MTNVSADRAESAAAEERFRQKGVGCVRTG